MDGIPGPWRQRARGGAGSAIADDTTEVVDHGVRVTIRVTPGSRNDDVGGSRNGTLVVRVRERAVEGRATEAALVAVAKALGVPRRAVSVVHGAASRTKVVEVAGDTAVLAQKIERLMARQ